MQEVEEFMSYYDLPEWLRARIRSHLNAQQMYLHDKDILSSLSGTLREVSESRSLLSASSCIYRRVAHRQVTLLAEN